MRPDAILARPGAPHGTVSCIFFAAAFGEWIRSLLPADVLRRIIGGSLPAIAVWTLKPDELEGTVRDATRYGVLAPTCVVFFIADAAYAGKRMDLTLKTIVEFREEMREFRVETRKTLAEHSHPPNVIAATIARLKADVGILLTSVPVMNERLDNLGTRVAALEARG